MAAPIFRNKRLNVKIEEIDSDIEDNAIAIASVEDDIDDIIDGTTPRTGAVLNTAHVGTAGTDVTAAEYGDGYHHVTVLTLDDCTIGTPTADSSDAIGALESLGHLHEGVDGSEDILTGQTWTETLDGAAAQEAGPLGATAGVLTGIALNGASDTKTVYLNAADGWHTDITGDLTADGTIVLVWDTIYEDEA